MVKTRKLYSMMLVLTLAFSLNNIAFAEDINPDNSNNGKQPNVIIENTDLEIPDYIIQELIRDNPDAGQIIITEYSNIGQSNELHDFIAQPMSVNYYTDVLKTTTAYDVLAKDVFVTSVARGQTQTLSYNWSETLSCSISGNIDYISLGITGSITKSYSKTDVFAGPPEDSGYNSREYRVKFFEDRGTYTANLHTDFPGWVIVIPESGNWAAPSRYLAYSINRVVE